MRCCEPCGVVIREITVDNVAIFHVRYIRETRAI
nr:MAG TPA: Isopullulanase beta-solenoid repeat [Caudoviricetes sp.]